jgi:creatinine amidohydrolase
MVTQICEAVRRYTAKQDREVALAMPPINYGGHPYHHLAMPGTYMVSEEVVRETLIYVMLGLWDDGYRKFILVNNHGHKWMLESAVHEFFKRYQLPAIVSELEWHRAVREFWIPIDEPDSFTTHFVHADEAETAVANLLFPDMVDMNVCVDAQPKSLALRGHYDTSVDSLGSPHTWSEGEGHNVIERFATPEGVVGYPSRGDAFKAKRPIAAICKYITLMINDMLENFPAGTAPVEGFTLRPWSDLEGCFKEPLSEGWVSVHELPKRGIFD